MSETSEKWSELGKAMVEAAEKFTQGIADFLAAWNENNKENN